jgi:hypothetical protein
MHKTHFQEFCAGDGKRVERRGRGRGREENQEKLIARRAKTVK